VVEAWEWPDRHVGAPASQALDGRQRAFIGNLLVVGAVVDAHGRLRAPLIDGVLAQADAQRILWVRGDVFIVGRPQECTRGRRQPGEDITARLLEQWRNPEEFETRRFFFCQLEAMETLI
jgi:hypothetical protein